MLIILENIDLQKINKIMFYLTLNEFGYQKFKRIIEKYILCHRTLYDEKNHQIF
jgi:hypothetical protein